MMPAMRPENRNDRSTIHGLLTHAFGGTAEAMLVDALRQDGALLVSLVAVEDDRIVGHVAASPMHSDNGGNRLAAAALAPLAVAPDRQRRGAGSALVVALLDALDRQQVDFVIVLGDPAWYQRFGFERAADTGLRTPFDGPALSVRVRNSAWRPLLAGRHLAYERAFDPFLPPA